MHCISYGEMSGKQNFRVTSEVEEHFCSPFLHRHVYRHITEHKSTMFSGMLHRLVVTDVSEHLSATIFRTIYSSEESVTIYQSILVQYRRSLESSSFTL
jgi:hypothetical protein